MTIVSWIWATVAAFIAAESFCKPGSLAARARSFMSPSGMKRTLSFRIAKPCPGSVELRLTSFCVGGFTADVCVYATLLEGYDLGYRMYAITDAVVAGDAAATKEMVRALYPFVSRPMPSTEFLAMFSPREGKAAGK